MNELSHNAYYYENEPAPAWWIVLLSGGAEPRDYPVDVLDVNGNVIGNAADKTTYMSIWNANTTNTGAIGFLVGEYFPFVFRVARKAAPVGVPQLATPSVSVSTVTTSGFTLSWPGVANANSYLVQVSTSPSFGSIIGSPMGSSLNYVFSGGSAGVTYYYRVIAKDTTAARMDSNPATGSRTTTAIPGSTLSTPNVATTIVTSGSVGLTWAEIANAFYYEVQKSLDNSSWSAAGSPITNGVSVTGLNPSTLYYFRVRAVGNGTTYLTGSYSASVNATTEAGSSVPNPVIYYGFSDSPTISEGSVPLLQYSASIVHNADFAANLTANGVPKYLHIAEPVGETPKTRWVENVNSSGTIDQDLFGSYTAGAFRVYSSYYQTYNTTDPYQFFKT